MSERENTEIQWRLEGTAKSMKEIPLGAEILQINGLQVAGQCENCRRYITHGEAYDYDGGGVVWCYPDCPTSENARG